MKFQKRNYTCGPASIVNALRCHGKKVSERNILPHSNTDSRYGTTEFGMMNAISRLGFSSVWWEDHRKRDSWSWLIRMLDDGVPVIISVQNWQHYVTCVGTIGRRVLVCDPARSDEGKKENGISVLSKRELLRKWWNSQKGLYSALAVKKK